MRQSFLGTLALSASLAISGCTTPSISEHITELRYKRAQVNTQVMLLIAEQAEKQESAWPESTLEQQIQKEHNLQIIGFPESKTDERLEKIKERFDQWQLLFGPNEHCHRLFLLDVPDDLEHHRDRAGVMRDNGDMIVWGRYAGKELYDHEYVHARQHNYDGTDTRHAKLTEILASADNTFQNKHYNKDKPGIWKDNRATPKQYFITPYACKNAFEYEAELYAETAKLFRGEPTNFKHIDYDLPLWPAIFRLSQNGIMPSFWADALTKYVMDEQFRQALHTSHKWNVNTEHPSELQAVVENYDNPQTRPIYSLFDNPVLQDEALRTKVFAHPKEAILAQSAFVNVPLFAGVLYVRNRRDNKEKPDNLGFLYIFEECIKDYDRVNQIYKSHLRSRVARD